MREREYAERVILNSIINNEPNLDYVMATLNESHYKNENVSAIVNIIRNLYYKNAKVDYSSISSEIINNEKLFLFFNDCVDNTATSKNIKQHVRKLVEFDIKDKLYKDASSSIYKWNPRLEAHGRIVAR
jgi:replicative DNA helicase